MYHTHVHNTSSITIVYYISEPMLLVVTSQWAIWIHRLVDMMYSVACNSSVFWDMGSFSHLHRYTCTAQVGESFLPYYLHVLAVVYFPRSYPHFQWCLSGALCSLDDLFVLCKYKLYNWYVAFCQPVKLCKSYLVWMSVLHMSLYSMQVSSLVWPYPHERLRPQAGGGGQCTSILML